MPSLFGGSHKDKVKAQKDAIDAQEETGSSWRRMREGGCLGGAITMLTVVALPVAARAFTRDR